MAALLDDPIGTWPKEPRTAEALRTKIRFSGAEERKTAEEWANEIGKMFGAGSLVLEHPDSYAAIRAPRPSVPCDDPNYQPHGTAPDGYAIALKKGTRR